MIFETREPDYPKIKADLDIAAAMIRKLGAKNVLYGTDYPMWNPRDEIDRFLQLDLTDGEKEDILWNNAARMFQL